MIPEHVYKLMNILDLRGQSYIVGGAVRDHILGIAPKDFDIEVYNIPAWKLVYFITNFYLVKKIDRVGKSFGVFKVYFHDESLEPVDISLPRKEKKIGNSHKDFEVESDPFMDPREAASRRDFTINSMMMSKEGKVYDPLNLGIEDLLDLKVLRHSSLAFIEDPLRVLRAMQFAARFDMTLAHETAVLCQSIKDEYVHLPLERIWIEWEKWALKSIAPKKGLEALRDSGWLDWYEDIKNLVGCLQNALWHPEGDVFEHTGYVCEEGAKIAVRENLNNENKLVLMFSALCHDMGKPSTMTLNEDGYIVNPGHAQAGVENTEHFLTSIGAPLWLIERVKPLVACHMDRVGATASPRFLRRLAQRLYPSTIADWARLVESDMNGRPPKEKEIDPLKEFLDLASQLDVMNNKPQMIVMGRHLLENGLYQPGPEMGIALRAAYEAQIEGAFEDLEGGLQWIKKTQLS